MKLEIVGMDKLRSELTGFAPRESRNIIRNVIGDVGRGIRDDIKKHVPVGVTQNLKKSIAVKTRIRFDAVEAEIYNRNKGYHWHLLEFGTETRYTKSGAHRGRVEERKFTRVAIAKGAKNLNKTIEESFGKRFTKALEKRMNSVK